MAQATQFRETKTQGFQAQGSKAQGSKARQESVTLQWFGDARVGHFVVGPYEL